LSFRLQSGFKKSRRAFAPAALVFCLLFVILFSKALAEQKAAPASKFGDQGKPVFVSNCAVCHGLDGRGGEHAPNIASNPMVRQLSGAELFRIIEHGIPASGMPSFEALGAPKVGEVVRYLRVLQGQHSFATLPGNPQQGRQLFFGKAACSSCHMIRGEGGFIGPDLSTYALTHSLQEIRQAIVNPNKNLGPPQNIVVAVTRQGQKYVGIARNEDNFSLQLQTPDGAFHLLMKSDLTSLRHEPRSLMPSKYRSRLSSQDLDDIISFLAKVSEAPSNVRVVFAGQH
jgi:cytochrome c oxidase cbb3-type subunit III